MNEGDRQKGFEFGRSFSGSNQKDRNQIERRLIIPAVLMIRDKKLMVVYVFIRKPKMNMLYAMKRISRPTK